MATKAKARSAQSTQAMAEMLLAAGKDAQRLYQGMETYKPQRAGGYVRISNDPFGLERGVNRQMQDIKGKADQLDWKLAKFYVENDTSAYRKKRITLPDGTVVWRVVRPQFRQMLNDLFTGVIDGIIVWDQDRLLRQPRDLEDLIDIVEAVRRPVTGITSSINLMTSDGRAMARVMAAMALKSSEDTARRVTRSKFQDALDGNLRTGRKFGRAEDGTVVEEEKEAAQKAAAIVLATNKWSKGTVYLERDSGVRPVGGGHWHMNTMRNMLLNPTIAGISVYRGAMRGDVAGKMNAADPQADAVRDAEGNYVMTGEPAILDVETWEALCAMVRETHEGKTPGVATAKKYLLSGLLRCGNIREDGTVCGRAMVGTRVKRPTRTDPDRHVIEYRCQGIDQGGCSGIARRAARVDEFIEDVFFKFLSKKAPKHSTPGKPAASRDLSEARNHLQTVQERLADLRSRYAKGDKSLSTQSYYATLPELESSVKSAQAKVAELERGTAPKLSASDVAEEWQAADTDGKRMILARYIEAIEVRPSKSRGRAPLDETAIIPAWKDQPTNSHAVTLAA